MRTNSSGSTARDRNASLLDVSFNYADLSPSVEKFLRGQADRIRRQCASSIIQIGKALLEAKRHLSHGAFLRWVESEIGFPARTSQAYMRVAYWASGKSATVAHLPPSALYVLSSNGVPEEFVVDVLERAQAGEKITASAVRQELRVLQEKRGMKLSANEPDAPRIFDEGTGYPVYETTIDSPIAELVALLSKKLSVVDFARVCEILTSNTVLSDPGLAEELARQFRSAAEDRSVLA